MADDQVKYSDLFDAGIDAQLQKLTAEITTLKDAIAAAKTEANGLRDGLRGAGTATRDQQQSTAADAAAVEALNRQVKDLTDKLNKLEEKKRRYKKLTDAEVQSVEDLRQALQGSAQEQIKAVQAIDIQAKSYNELNAIYNELKTSLNAMTVAERENTAAGKEMVNRAKEIRDVMNNLQQQTGNYALNVGNYMSAMNGLQMQTQQILREIPSAQNLSQFFLAISNNIPMFTDALARYNKVLPEIRAKLAAVTAEITRQEAALAGMNAQSTEYAAKQAQINELRRQEQQLQSASVSGWRAILKSVGSWQTLLIAGLLLLRKIPDLVKKISERWGSARKELHRYTNEMSAAAASAQVMADVTKKVNDEATELNLIVDSLGYIKQGTKEWEDAISAVNKITGQNLNATTATVDSVRDVTRAYMEQAEQLATNSILTDKIAKSNANKQLRNRALSASNLTDLRMLLGIDEDSKEYKELEKTFSSVQRVRKEAEETIRKNMPYWGEAAVQSAVVDAIKTSSDYGVEVFRKIIYKNFEILSDDAESQLRNSYRVTAPLQNGGSSRSGSQPSEKTVTSRYWEAQEALLREQYKGYQLEQQLAKLNHDKALAEQEAWYTDQQKNLEENVKNGFITRKDADKELAELDRQKTDIEKGIERKYWEDLRALRMKNLSDRKKEWKANADEVEKAAKDGAKAELKAAVDGWAQYKAKMVEEGKTRKQIVEAEVAAEIARLNLMLKLNRDVNGEIMSDEQKAKVQEWINLLEKLQKTGNYGDYKPGQFIGKGGANVTNERKNYANIWEVLGIDMNNNQVSALNSVFDQAKEALNSWMDARKAAADQAKELADDEVSAAENALNREIELRNQGYANDVALREKELADAKQKQKEAVEEQKKIAQEQILLDAALQTSSLITASANILKQFAAQPLLAASLLGLMWGSFGYAKIKAYQASTKSIKFKEGGVMLLEGGSHESGHDVNLGVGPDGSNLRAEGGEYFAVINKRSSRKYGSQIPAVVNALNSGMFEDRYIKTSDAVGLLPQVIRADNGTSVDLSSLEGGVDALVKQGESRWSVEGEYRVMRYKNLTRRVRIG